MSNTSEHRALGEKIKEIFNKYRVHNPEFALEKEIEGNPSLMSQKDVTKKLSASHTRSISFNEKEGWEKYQMITIGNDFCEFSAFLAEIRPVYVKLASVTMLFKDAPETYFKIMSFDDITLIGLQPKTEGLIL